MRTLLSTCAVLLLASIGGSASNESQAGFNFNRIDTAANAAPRSIVSADFNRDGFPDVALGGTNPASIGILLHHGLEEGDEGQRFTPLIEVPVGGGPFDMAVADLNRDDWPDLAVANADSNAITILLNNRTPIPFNSSFDIAVGENPRGIAVGDFNRDAKPDLVVTRFTGTSAEIRYGAGDGTFPTGALVDVPEGSQGVATGDFNADGWTDWVVVSYAGYAVFTYMRAEGVSHQQHVPLDANLNVVTTGDFDNNGWLDIAAASTSASTVQIMFRTADEAQFNTSTSYSVASSPRGLETADLNNDGWLELVAAGRNTSAVSVLTRTADGSYVDTQHAAGTGARDITLVDFNQDTRIDILTANEYGNSTTLLVNRAVMPMSAWAFDRLPLEMQWDLRAFGVADFNSNGIPDVVLREHIVLDMTTTSRRFVDAGREDGTIGDFNRDGRMDILFAGSGQFSGFRPALRILFGNGAGDFTSGPLIFTGSTPSLMRAADMNRDGRLDLVMRLAARLEIWLGNGDGTFAPSSPQNIAAIWIEVADVNRDGLLDIVATTSTGVQTLLGDGTGAVQPFATFGAGSTWQGFGLGEMTSDGILDLVAIETQDHPTLLVKVASAVVVARGRGDGTFEEYSRTAPARPLSWSTFSTLLLADLNHDGALDVFTGNGQFMQGGGILGEPQLFAARGSTRMHAVDMNRDGLLDVVGVGHDTTYSDPQNMIMLNTRRTPVENRAPTGVTLPDIYPYPYARYFYAEDEPEISAGFNIVDPDLHALRHEWRREDGTVVSTSSLGYAPGPEMTPGRYPMTFTVDDYRGGVTTRNFTLEMTPYKEAVIHPQSTSVLHGAWQLVRDDEANEGWRLWHPNVDAPKLQAPLAAPTDYVDIGFLADPTQEYKLWVRLKADGDYWGNDSVYIQFSGAADSAGNAAYRIGTASALAINLEECSNCGISGWGWEDDGWGAVNANGVTLRFPEGGRQILRIQAREDGVSIDTIVLSAERYKTTRPGSAKNDNTLLPSTGPWMGTWWF